MTTPTSQMIRDLRRDMVGLAPDGLDRHSLLVCRKMLLVTLALYESAVNRSEEPMESELPASAKSAAWQYLGGCILLIVGGAPLAIISGATAALAVAAYRFTMSLFF